MAVSNSIEVKKHVAATPNSIGYIERTQVDASVKVLVTK
jgi:ABC-type phosphate transport system substrate-binding protein